MNWFNNPKLKEEVFELFDSKCEYDQEHDDILIHGWKDIIEYPLSKNYW